MLFLEGWSASGRDNNARGTARKLDKAPFYIKHELYRNVSQRLKALNMGRWREA